MMMNGTSDPQKDDHEQKDSLLKLNNDENLSTKDGLLKLHISLSRKYPQHLFVSNNGKWLQIVKNGHKGLFFRHGARTINSKIPRHVVSRDEKYLRRCLEMIHISASKSASYGSASTVINPTVAGYKNVIHMLDKPYLHKLGALDMDPSSMKRRKDEEKGLVSCDFASSLSLLKIGKKSDLRVWNHQSESICEKVVSLSNTDSTCFSSEFSSSSVTSTSFSQGTLLFTMNAEGLPHFVFTSDDKDEIFVAGLSNVESGFNSGALEHTYLIHLRKSSGNESYLVGKIKVSTLFSVSSSSLNNRTMEREFVLFSGYRNFQMQYKDTRKSKGLPKKVVDAFKNTRASRQRSISRFSRASSIPDVCPWEPFQEPDYDLEPVNLLENDLPTNLESSAVIVKEQLREKQEEEVLGGWGMKFLKSVTSAQNFDASETSKPSTSMDVIIPSGIHGGSIKKNGGPSSLIQRWKSGGICDCGGWDLGCPVTTLKGQPRKDQDEGECNLFELSTEGPNSTPGLRIVEVHDGVYLVQFQRKISFLQSFSIAIAYIHSQSQSLRPRPESVQKNLS